MDRGQPGLALGEGDRGHRGEVAGEHGGPPHRRGGQRRGPSDGVGHEARERALPELAEQQPADQLGFGLGGRREQRGQAGAAGARRSRAGERGEVVERGVEVAHGEDRARGGLDVDLADGRPPDTDAALAGRACQQRDRGHHLVGRQPGEQVGEQRDLGRPRRGRPDLRVTSRRAPPAARRDHAPGC